MVLRTTAEDELRDGPDSAKRYEGKYLAFVRDSNDPERRGRVRVHCPEVMGEVDEPNTWLDWAEAAHTLAGFDQGLFMVPPDPTWNSRDDGGPSSPYNETRVWVTFRNGDVERPVYELGGNWYGERELPSGVPALADASSGGDETTADPNYTSTTKKCSVLRATDAQQDQGDGSAGDLVDGGEVREPAPASEAVYPRNYLFKSPAGHVIEVDNTPGAERFRVYHPAGSSMEINQSGSWAEKVQGNRTQFVTDNLTSVVKGSATEIVEGAAHRQVNRTLTEVYKDSRVEVVNRSYEAYYKGGWSRSVTGKVSLICADYQAESTGTITLIAGGGASVTADVLSLQGSSSIEMMSDDTVIKSIQGVRQTTGARSLATHPIYSSLNIDQDLQAYDTQLDTLRAALTGTLAPSGAPGAGVNVPGTTYAIQTLIAAVGAIIASLKRNKSDHLVGPAKLSTGVDLPDIPDIPDDIPELP